MWCEEEVGRKVTVHSQGVLSAHWRARTRPGMAEVMPANCSGTQGVEHLQQQSAMKMIDVHTLCYSRVMGTTYLASQ